MAELGVGDLRCALVRCFLTTILLPLLATFSSVSVSLCKVSLLQLAIVSSMLSDTIRRFWGGR